MAADFLVMSGERYFHDALSGLDVPDLSNQPLIFVVGWRLGRAATLAVASQFNDAVVEENEVMVCVPLSVFESAAQDYMQHMAQTAQKASVPKLIIPDFGK